MAVSSGYSATFTLKSYAYHGGKVYVEFGDYCTKLTACYLHAAVVESMFVVI